MVTAEDQKETIRCHSQSPSHLGLSNFLLLDPSSPSARLRPAVVHTEGICFERGIRDVGTRLRRRKSALSSVMRNCTCRQRRLDGERLSSGFGPLVPRPSDEMMSQSRTVHSRGAWVLGIRRLEDNMKSSMQDEYLLITKRDPVPDGSQSTYPAILSAGTGTGLNPRLLRHSVRPGSLRHK